nr:hypothetical protein [Tanacetum cinerariifolium]
MGKQTTFKNNRRLDILKKAFIQRKVINGSSDGIAAVTNKLDSLGRDTKKLKENVHAIQVGCKKPMEELILTKNFLFMKRSRALRKSKEETHEEIKEVMEIEETSAHHEPATRKLTPSEGGKMELILDVVLDKVDDDWFSGTINDEDDLDGIVDYMELKSHDDFVNINDEGYKERMCKLLGITYKKPSSILIKKVEVTRYTIRLGESYTKVRILEIKEMPKTSANIAVIRAELMEEMDTTASVQRETFVQQEDGSSRSPWLVVMWKKVVADCNYD